MSFDPRPDWTDLADLVGAVTEQFSDGRKPADPSGLREVRHRAWQLRNWLWFVYAAVPLHDDPAPWVRRCQRRMVLLGVEAYTVADCPQQWLDILAGLGKASEIVELIRNKDRSDWGPGDLPRAAGELEAAAWAIDGYLIDLGFAPPWKDFSDQRHP